MSTTTLAVWLTIAVLVMFFWDIFQFFYERHNKKLEKAAEERRLKAEEEMAKAYKPPTIHTVHHDVVTLKVKDIIPKEAIITHDTRFISEEICEKLACEIMDKNLVNVVVYSRFEDGAMCYEATLKVVDPKGEGYAEE